MSVLLGTRGIDKLCHELNGPASQVRWEWRERIRCPYGTLRSQIQQFIPAGLFLFNVADLATIGDHETVSDLNTPGHLRLDPIGADAGFDGSCVPGVAQPAAT